MAVNAVWWKRLSVRSRWVLGFLVLSLGASLYELVVLGQFSARGLGVAAIAGYALYLDMRTPKIEELD
jgi:hypothetical protein